MKTILVLPDGETWNTLDGCSICVITEEDFELLSNDRICAHDLNPVVEIALRNFYGPAPFDPR